MRHNTVVQEHEPILGFLVPGYCRSIWYPDFLLWGHSRCSAAKLTLRILVRANTGITSWVIIQPV